MKSSLKSILCSDLVVNGFEKNMFVSRDIAKLGHCFLCNFVLKIDRE
jgi:hypothetical protein